MSSQIGQQLTSEMLLKLSTRLKEYAGICRWRTCLRGCSIVQGHIRSWLCSHQSLPWSTRKMTKWTVTLASGSFLILEGCLISITSYPPKLCQVRAPLQLASFNAKDLVVQLNSWLLRKGPLYHRFRVSDTTKSWFQVCPDHQHGMIMHLHRQLNKQ